MTFPLKIVGLLKTKITGDYIQITTDQTTLQTVGITLTFASGTLTADWGDGSSNENFVSGVELTHSYGSTAVYNIKIYGDLTNITQLIADNNRITSITRLKTGLLFNLRLQNNLLTTLDLGSAPVDALLFVHNNPDLYQITFASSGNGNLYYGNFSSCNFSSLDFSNINTGSNAASGSFNVSNNPLTSITWKSSGNQQLAGFQATNTLLTSLDFSNQPIKTTLSVYANSLLTDITFATTGNGILTTATLYQNDLSSLDFSNVLFGSNATLSAYSNSNMSAVTLASSGNGSFKNVLLNGCNLSSFDFQDAIINQTVATDNVNFSNNPSLSSITIANSGSGTLINYRDDLCDMTDIDFSVFGTSDNVSIQKQNNSMTSTEVDNQLINLDGTSWINGTLNIAGTNGARTTASDTAYANLVSNGWTITAN